MELDPSKFRDPATTAKGRASCSGQALALRTLWINTGTLCNIACNNCYIELTPSNDRLAYISAAEIAAYLDEIEQGRLPVELIGFTGGEPFMNRDTISALRDVLERGFKALVLTNAMRPMRHFENDLLALKARFRNRLTIRVQSTTIRASFTNASGVREAGSRPSMVFNGLPETALHALSQAG